MYLSYEPIIFWAKAPLKTAILPLVRILCLQDYSFTVIIPPSVFDTYSGA